MELVAGETLADRIKSDGALPLVEALEHAEAIACDHELKATNPGDK